MQPPTLLNGTSPLALTQPNRAEGGVENDRPERTVLCVVSRDALPNDVTTADGLGVGLKGDNEVDRDSEMQFQDWIGHFARAKARYRLGDTACEADFRAAFLVDARLTTSEFIRELKRELRNDISDLVHDCQRRLAANPGDAVSLARLGLTLLLLYQDESAYTYLQRAFVHHSLWRPLLRSLVKKAKLRREDVLDFILGPCKPERDCDGD